jgi:dolichol-phosphate mannosyltransferase
MKDESENARQFLLAPSSFSQALEISVIVPTYGEAENLRLLVPRIGTVLEQAGLRGEILIVDDDSPDDTVAVCAQLAERLPVRLLVRKGQRGLSTAVLFAARQARGDILLVMDADLSHPPEKIPELYQAIRSGEADFVLGSRYVASGSTDRNWGLYRWINSQLGRWLARPLVRAQDPGAGFFALHRTTLERAGPLNPISYKVGLELLVKCGCRKVKEVPIHFQNRVHGQSKLSLREQINYLHHLFRLYAYRLGRACETTPRKV